MIFTRSQIENIIREELTEELPKFKELYVVSNAKYHRKETLELNPVAKLLRTQSVRLCH